MKKVKWIAAILMALCLAVAPALADEEDFYDVAGVWYSEEIQMEISEDGRFVIGWNDGDWTGSLDPEWRTNEDGDEYVAYRLVLDNPEDSAWEVELVTDIYHPGRILYVQDGTPIEYYWKTPVSVVEITDEEELDYYPQYAYVDAAEGEEPAVMMMFTFLRPARNIAVMKLFDQEFDEEGNFGYSADTLEWWEEMDSQERIVVTYVFEGDLPELSLSFQSDDGEWYNLAVEISGADGVLDFSELDLSNG